jgi:tetratricopeptide (TPR) repeat protein
MAKKNFLIGRERELQELAERYEEAKEAGNIPYFDPYEYADLTDWYVMRQNISQAEKALEDGLSMHPDNEALLIEKCHLLLDYQRYEEAYELSNRIMLNGSDPAIILKGSILLQQGNAKEAKKVFATIHEADDMYNIIDICYAYLDNDMVKEATKWLNYGKETFANEEPFVALKADYYYHTEKYKKAIDCYNQLIDINPYSPIYWTGMARCYIALDAFDKAIEACDYALVSDENYHEPLLIKAQAFGALGNNEEAYKCYKKTFEMGGMSLEAWDDISAIYLMDHGNYQEALEVFERIENTPDRKANDIIDAYRAFNMGLCKLESQAFEEAHQYFSKAIKLNPELIDAYLRDGLTLALLERNEETLMVWEQAVKLSPTAQTLFDLGRISMQVGYFAMSLKSFQMVEQLEDDFPLVREFIANIYLLVGKRPEFEEYNKKATYAIPGEIIPQLYSKLEKADDFTKMAIIQQYFEQYVLIPHSVANR